MSDFALEIREVSAGGWAEGETFFFLWNSTFLEIGFAPQAAAHLDDLGCEQVHLV